MLVQPADGLLQPLLLLLRQDVRQLVAGLQEHIQHPLVQLAKTLLDRGTKIFVLGNANVFFLHLG